MRSEAIPRRISATTPSPAVSGSTAGRANHGPRLVRAPDCRRASGAHPFLGFFVTIIAVPAMVMLGYRFRYRFLLQFLSGLPALGETRGGVAFGAHIGGIACGFLVIGLFRRADYLAQHRAAPASRRR